MLDDHSTTTSGPGMAPAAVDFADDGATGKGASRTIKAVLLGLKAGPVFILLLLMLGLWIGTENHVFLTLGNLGNVLEQSAGVCVIALGQLLVILTRGIDLSIGSNVSLCCVVVTVVYRDSQSGFLAIAVTLLTGLVVGAVNGLLLVKGRLPHPFIITLATLSICRGIAYSISANHTTMRGMPDAVVAIGGGDIFGIPNPFIVVVICACLVLLMMKAMVWGRWIYAVGGAPEAAVEMGIPVKWVLVSTYVIAGLCCGPIGMSFKKKLRPYK